MSCYSGGTATTTYIAEVWHPIESFYDSLDGKSPLMQLCRKVNDLRMSLGLSEYSFHRIGTDTSDTKFATLDYEAHPDWDSLYDYDYILNQCSLQIQTVLIIATFGGDPIPITGDDCYNRYYTDAAVWRSEIGFTGVTLLGSLFKEHCMAKMLLLREYLDRVEGSEITTEAWTTHTVTFGWDNALLDTTRAAPEYSGGSGEKGKYDPAAVSEGFPSFFTHKFGATGHDEFNLFANRSASCFPDHTTSGALAAYFVRHMGTSLSGPGAPDYYYSVIEGDVGDYCAGGSDMGWFTRDTTTVTFRLQSVSVPPGFDLSLLEGHAIHWEIEPVYSAELPHISWSGSPTTGTISAVVSGALNTTDIVATFNMDDANIANNWPEAKSVGFRIHFTGGNTLTVCKDACGNYHLDGA